MPYAQLYKNRFCGLVLTVSDQWLSTTLDQNVALLIGLWQNTELIKKLKLNNYFELGLTIQQCVIPLLLLFDEL